MTPFVAAVDEPMLTGLRVLDLSQGIAGPYCGDILQQQGAEVIKVEPPAGDWARTMGYGLNGFTAPVLAYNAGKLGLCVDAGSATGRGVLQRVAQQVDVVIQNFRPGVVDRLGIGYDSLRTVNERLVYVSISGFGPDGPLADVPATDNVMQAMTGMMYANRNIAGFPQRIGIYLADVSAALYASQLVCAALYRRGVTGAGRHVQVSLLAACAALQSSNIVDSILNADKTAARSATAPGGIFSTTDGFVTVATLNDAMFARLCEAVGCGQWIRDERFSTAQSRLAHADAVNQLLGARLSEECLGYWLPKLRASEILHAAIATYVDLVANDQVTHAKIFSAIRNPGLPDVPRARHPGCNSPADASYAPRVGQHTTQVLMSFGFSAHEIDELIAAKAVHRCQS